MSSEYGYIRVSSTDQNEDRQLVAMQSLNIPRTHLYMDDSQIKLRWSINRNGVSPYTTDVNDFLIPSRLR